MSDFTKLKVKKNGKEYVLNVCTQDTEQNITGTKNFSKLTVNSKNVVTSINGIDADTQGNVTVSTSLEVDYSSGINITSSLNTKNSSWTAPKNGIVQARIVNQQYVYLYRELGIKHLQTMEKAFIALDGEGGVVISDNMSIPQNYTIYTSSDLNNNGTIIFYPFK